MTQVSVFDCPVELWQRIHVDAKGGDLTYWKTLETPTLRIVIFEPESLSSIRDGAR